VNFVDPAADFSRLLGRYRRRAVALLAVSAVLMLPLLALRYRLSGAIRVMLPAVLTIVLVPLAKALLGDPFTFFDAMALVLVLVRRRGLRCFLRRGRHRLQARCPAGCLDGHGFDGAVVSGSWSAARLPRCMPSAAPCCSASCWRFCWRPMAGRRGQGKGG